MARPIKMGLDYFPFDVDIFEDEKVIPISSEFGAKGECIVVRVLCAIYREGYFAECSPAFKFKIAKQANVSHTLVDEVVTGLVKWGFFDKSVFDSFGVLTSAGIQKRWKEATRKRVPAKNLQYWVLDEDNKDKCKTKEFLPEETPLTRSESTQKKRKEKKGDNIISTDVDISKSEKQASRTQIDYKKLIEFFNSETKGVFGEVRYPISSKRQDSIRARIREHGKEAFVEMVRKAAASEFLKGNNNRGFQATFDWLIRPTNFQKTIEGNYDNRNKETKRINTDVDRLRLLAREAEEAFRS
jgi:hypothetical protein